MTSTTDWHFEANEFLRNLIIQCDETDELCTVNVSIYDTAWVSMVSKTIDGKTEWLFPQSFQLILDSQSSDGGWEVDKSPVDAIVTTLACVLALKRHQSTAPVYEGSEDDINYRIDIAVKFLNSKLDSWDVSTTERIAFELIIPSLLKLLEIEYGIIFRFRDYNILVAIHHKKMAMIDNSMIYKFQSTCHYTLEAFIGRIDFNRLRNLKHKGSFMSSPASTAAYLMNVSSWDEEAEQFLRYVLVHCKRYGNGGVSIICPTTAFEFSWSIVNLFENGFEMEKLDKCCLDRIKDILKRILTAQNGLVGFAEGVLPDADGTAKTLAALYYLGDQFSVEPLIKKFEIKTHFLCYEHERNPSISANSNILITLLHASMPERYTSQIVKALTFLCDTWWTSKGMLADKWHQSWIYPAMLMSQGLTRLLYLHHEDVCFSSLSDDLIRNKVHIILLQLMVRLLQSQSNVTGCWGMNGSREETSYAIIALANLASLPFAELLRTQIDVAVARGQAYLSSTTSSNLLETEQKERLWISKTVYGVGSVHQSYILAALQTSALRYSFNSEKKSCLPVISVEKSGDSKPILLKLNYFFPS
ncbi:unnamed protein product [Adineta steineri]|uniref:Uncharacterized protein n=1 Tax=Adineta steineri TaxID=433720 RepID=A0A815LV30_9BILA|nr:unnamed protein product [Adineta steineri]CAF4043573.1 unnamed protein product [Adineta steineri]